MDTRTRTHIKAREIKPGDIIRFEYGTYDNWVTVRIEATNPNSNPHSYFPLELIWHYLSDEPKEASEDCRAEKLGNNPGATSSAPTPYKQFTCYSSLDSIVEKLN
jgi:hypothetical protein